MQTVLMRMGVLVEGAFYVWKQHEIKDLFPNEHELVSDYYSINESGYWEDGNYVLRRLDTDEKFAEKHKIDLSELKTKILHWNTTLSRIRNKRKLPKLDDKIICSWNAMLTSGLLEAYISFKNSSYLELALKNIKFIEQNFITNSGVLRRIFKKGGNQNRCFFRRLCHSN